MCPLPSENFLGLFDSVRIISVEPCKVDYLINCRINGYGAYHYDNSFSKSHTFLLFYFCFVLFIFVYGLIINLIMHFFKYFLLMSFVFVNFSHFPSMFFVIISVFDCLLPVFIVYPSVRCYNVHE